jgi:hypothetical protein
VFCVIIAFVCTLQRKPKITGGKMGLEDVKNCVETCTKDYQPNEKLAFLFGFLFGIRLCKQNIGNEKKVDLLERLRLMLNDSYYEVFMNLNCRSIRRNLVNFATKYGYTLDYLPGEYLLNIAKLRNSYALGNHAAIKFVYRNFFEYFMESFQEFEIGQITLTWLEEIEKIIKYRISEKPTKRRQTTAVKRTPCPGILDDDTFLDPRSVIKNS